MTMMLIPKAVLDEALNAMARGYERIHSLPRISDTSLADHLERAKVQLREAAVPAHHSPVHPFPAEIKVWPRQGEEKPDVVAHVLGLAAQPWNLTFIARTLQRAERPIPMRAEAELAAALHFLLVHVLIDPEKGLENAEAELKAMYDGAGA